MSDEQKPDAIVREQEARAAKDLLVGGLAEDARAVGSIPNVRAIEEFVVPLVADTIARHEERFRNGVTEPAKMAPVAGSTPIAQEKAPDAEMILRPLGTFKGGADGKLAPVGELHERLREKRARAAKVDQLLAARLMLLISLPEWDARLLAAYQEGARVAIMRGIHTDKEIESLATDEAMKVVEASNAIFGDWQTPKVAPLKIFSGA